MNVQYVAVILVPFVRFSLFAHTKLNSIFHRSSYLFFSVYCYHFVKWYDKMSKKPGNWMHQMCLNKLPAPEKVQ